jgi:hypothetical protein
MEQILKNEINFNQDITFLHLRVSAIYHRNKTLTIEIKLLSFSNCK